MTGSILKISSTLTNHEGGTESKATFKRFFEKCVEIDHAFFISETTANTNVKKISLMKRYFEDNRFEKFIKILYFLLQFFMFIF